MEELELQKQFENNFEFALAKFYEGIKKDEHGAYVFYNEKKKQLLFKTFEDNITALKSIMKPNTDEGSTRLDRFKLASASVRAIVDTAVFEVDKESLKSEVSEEERVSVYILQPNEAFAYHFCINIINQFGKEGKSPHFENLPNNFRFRYPLTMLHFTMEDELHSYPFDKFFAECIVYYNECEKDESCDHPHFPMLAFANILNVLDVSSDCYQSQNFREFYYE